MEENKPSRACPCRLCPDREVGCHGNCERYQEWHRMRMEAKAADRAKRPYGGTVSDHAVRKIWQNQRYGRKNFHRGGGNSDR